MHMDDLQIDSTFFLKLAFFCVPVLFLSRVVIFHMFQGFPITIMFFLFLLGTSPRLPHGERGLWLPESMVMVPAETHVLTPLHLISP